MSFSKTLSKVLGKAELSECAFLPIRTSRTVYSQQQWTGSTDHISDCTEEKKKRGEFFPTTEKIERSDMNLEFPDIFLPAIQIVGGITNTFLH